MTTLLGPLVAASQSQFQQEIKPFECIYTTTETGNGQNTVENCQNQQVPTVEEVVVNAGRPVLRGMFQASKALMLRVWINSQWYTYGTDARLSVTGDEWALDLSNLSAPLAAGDYEVIVEVETNDGLLLRHVSAATFFVSTEAAASDHSGTIFPPSIFSLIYKFFSSDPGSPSVTPADNGVDRPSTGQVRNPLLPDQPTPDAGTASHDTIKTVAIVVGGVIVGGGGVALVISRFRLLR
jgi:hypothetical protein